MNMFELDRRLQQDCHQLGELPLSTVLLHRNAGVSWFILVPRSRAREIIDLAIAEQQQLLTEINHLAGFIRQTFMPHKLNIAAIGNIVPQLHVHVVGRYEHDYCWPDVVWGTSSDAAYDDARVRQLRDSLAVELDDFKPA